MTAPKCPICNAESFEVKELEQNISDYKLIFVLCSSCGSTIGVTTYLDTSVIEKNHEFLIFMLKQMHNLIISLHQLVQVLQETTNSRGNNIEA